VSGRPRQLGLGLGECDKVDMAHGPFAGSGLRKWFAPSGRTASFGHTAALAFGVEDFHLRSLIPDQIARVTSAPCLAARRIFNGLVRTHTNRSSRRAWLPKRFCAVPPVRKYSAAPMRSWRRWCTSPRTSAPRCSSSHCRNCSARPSCQPVQGAAALSSWAAGAQREVVHTCPDGSVVTSICARFARYRTEETLCLFLEAGRCSMTGTRLEPTGRPQWPSPPTILGRMVRDIVESGCKWRGFSHSNSTTRRSPIRVIWRTSRWLASTPPLLAWTVHFTCWRKALQRHCTQRRACTLLPIRAEKNRSIIRAWPDWRVVAVLARWQPPPQDALRRRHGAPPAASRSRPRHRQRPGASANQQLVVRQHARDKPRKGRAQICRDTILVRVADLSLDGLSGARQAPRPEADDWSMRPLRFGPLRVALNSGAAGLRVRFGVIPMTSLNTGRPWSPMNLVDLESGLAFGSSIEMIAEFLMRDVEEVRQKAASLKAPVATGQTSMNGL